MSDIDSYGFIDVHVPHFFRMSVVTRIHAKIYYIVAQGISFNMTSKRAVHRAHCYCRCSAWPGWVFRVQWLRYLVFLLTLYKREQCDWESLH